MRRVVELLGRLVATACWTGYSPLAPGTAGSALGVLLFWPLARGSTGVQLLACSALALVGTAAAERLARSVGQKDPSIVVVDEVAGQWLTFVALPFTPAVAAAGFFLFRLLDMVKPWPARDLERLPGGWGIMADDLAAGLYAQLVLRVGLILWPVGSGP